MINNNYYQHNNIAFGSQFKATDSLNNKDVPAILLEKTNKLLETMNEKLGMKAMDYVRNLDAKIFGKV